MHNQAMIQFFEWYCSADGQHWNRFAREVEKLQSLGITAVWLPPAYKGTRGAASEGYDVYDIYDLGEFDQKGTIRTKYGTKEEYVKAVNTARAKGMKVYVDIVLNHMGGAEEIERIRVKKVDADNRMKFISDEMEIEAYTKFKFPGRAGKYSAFQWDHQCFTGIDHIADREENAILSIINDYGDSWEPLVHDEKGNFDYLMLNDIETRNPAVRQELKNWIKWYYDTVPFDGLRLDAVKHINPSFFNEWLDYIRNEINPGLFVLGEYWLSDDLPVLHKYIKATEGRMSLFDAPLHHNLSQASIEREKYDLRNILDITLVRTCPALSVTFVDNHDTQPLQSLEEYTEQWFKPHAYALILLRKDGYPCIFYPDLYGACYNGKNKSGKDCNVNIPALDCLPSLLILRKEYSYGEQVDYFHDPNCVGWIRRGDETIPHSGCAVLLSNHPSERMSMRMSIGKKFAGKTFYDFLKNGGPAITIDDEGVGEFHVDPASAAVWVLTG
ncbi:MAG: alpha-amylase [Bacteroidetes bacterium]|nr:MAG: alpha-amylase [Bacteroidota bacterium]